VKTRNAHALAEHLKSAIPEGGWLSKAQRDRRGDGEPRPNLYNAMLALREDARFSDLFSYDEMLRAPILNRPVPAQGGGTQDEQFQARPIRDADVAALQELLQASGLEKIGKDVVHQAVDLRAVELRFHPVRDYLSALEWDGTPRLERWLATYLGAEDSQYHSASSVDHGSAITCPTSDFQAKTWPSTSMANG
jgi:predicted P-loop ATPase